MEKFGKPEIDKALVELSMLEFFPADPGTRGAIGLLLAKMCPSKEALRWLVSQMVNHVGKWHGPMELRGVLCTRFRPVDGVEADSSLSGYSPADGEMRALEAHEQLKISGTVPEDRPRLKAREWPALPAGKPQ